MKCGIDNRLKRTENILLTNCSFVVKYNTTTMKNTGKRQRILDAALGLFRDAHDVRKVSVEDIARRAGVSPTTVYNNFGTREELLNEVVRILVLESIERNRDIVHSDTPFPQKLMSIMGGKLDLVQRLNTEIITKLVSQDKNVAPFIDRIYREEIKPLLTEILADGKRQGYIEPSLNDEALLIYLDVMKSGFQGRPDLTREITGKLPLLKELTGIMFYGFLKKDIDLFQKDKNPKS